MRKLYMIGCYLYRGRRRRRCYGQTAQWDLQA